jgi:acyl-CoA dehydrogenase
MQEIHASGCKRASCHAQMYTKGTILRHGNAEKARYLPNIASGKITLQAFGVTEPTSGPGTLRLRTTAVRDGDHYVVNGQKIWTLRIDSDLHLSRSSALKLGARHGPAGTPRPCTTGGDRAGSRRRGD